MTATKHTKTPWRVAAIGTPTPCPEGATGEQRAKWDTITADMSKPFRDNDGSYIITCDAGRIAAVTFRNQDVPVRKRRTTEDAEALANLDLILRAVNSHAALVEALRGMLDPREKRWKVTDWDIRCAAARAALALVEGGGK